VDIYIKNIIMGKFILTEEDKKDILKMYGRISEQETPTSSLVGKKFNVYSDPQNSKFKFAVTISNVDKDSFPKGAKITGVNAETSKDMEIFFDCTKNDELSTKGLLGGASYSNNLTRALSVEFCIKNKSGKIVPKADFASTGAADTSNMA
jgi:hypothetical protein